MSQRVQFDRIGYWSEVKLDILKRYAAAYSRILSRQPSLSHVYIDAFAGAGIHVRKHEGTFVLGSPLNALNVSPPFREYHLIDVAPEKLANLNKFVAGRKDVFIYHGDCNKILLNQVFPN